MDYYKLGTLDIPILDPTLATDRDTIWSRGATFGAKPRNYTEDPVTMHADPTGLPVIDPTDWDAYYDEQEAQQSSLEHLFLRGGQPAFVNLDQNGDGHCWAYSTGHAMMLAALRDNRPVARLNPHFVASYLKRFDGGWCGASAKVFQDVGCCVEGTGADQWPLHSNNSSAITAERLAAAALHKTVENWYDLARAVWDQELTNRQIATCSFMNVPTPEDYNWWGHSVCGLRHVRVERGSWGRLILNSWLGWGRYGLAVLRGSQSIADGAVAIRVAA